MSNIAVDIRGDDCYDCENDVDVEKGLVKCVSKGRHREDSNQNESYCSHCAPSNKRVSLDSCPHSRHSRCCMLDVDPATSVNYYLGYNDSADPSVEKIVSIKANLK